MPLTSSHPAAAVLAEVLAEHGVHHAVMSPGSRNAPLVLAFHHHPGIELHVCIDERSAAHVAMGLALATWTPVPVICTSGTAALNHGPALAEAFHARIPLLSITADRPASSIGRGHGQTIVQNEVHALHTIYTDVLDESTMTTEELTGRARKAVQAAISGGPGQSSGPVHLNVPFEEPLYDLTESTGISEPNEAPLHSASSPQTFEVPTTLQSALERGTALLVAGPRPTNCRLERGANLTTQLPCLAERGSGVSGPLVMHGADRWVSANSWPEGMKPEAVITIGLPVMSKTVRHTFVNVPHWHIGEDLEHEGMGWDIWRQLNGSVPHGILQHRPPEEAIELWQKLVSDVDQIHTSFSPGWSDLAAWQTMVRAWGSWEPKRRPHHLHLANSTSARYAQWVDLQNGLQNDAIVHANRGVAGIDGCTSTAVGMHLANRQISRSASTWLVTGDLAFHYDSNALLSTGEMETDGFKIVVINNGGGGIFRWLPGTQHEHAFQRLFETPANRTVQAVAQAMGASFLQASEEETLISALNQASRCSELVVIEVITENRQSENITKAYLQEFKRLNLNN